MIGLLVKNEAKKYAKIRLAIFFMFWLSIPWYVDQFLYLMLLVDFKSIKTELIKKFMQEHIISGSIKLLLWR